MSEPEEEISAENPPVHYFPDKARPGFSPFDSSDTLKFVHLSPERLKRWASEAGVILSGEDLENGVILIGPATMNHRDLLVNNFGLSRDPRDRLKIDGFGCLNAGFIANIVGNEHALAQSSGDLDDEKGKPFFSKSDAEMIPLHQVTAAALNKIYQGTRTFVTMT